MRSKLSPKRFVSLIFAIIAVFSFTFNFFNTKVFAASSDDCTSVLDAGCDGENGEGIWKILNQVVDIMTFGIGVLATVGLVTAGIMYATASGSEERTKKAKNWIFNIVIGLLLYGFMWAILNFIIPGGVF